MPHTSQGALRTFAIYKAATSERASSCLGGALNSSPTQICSFDWVNPELATKGTLFPAEYKFLIDPNTVPVTEGLVEELRQARLSLSRNAQ